jgi:Zn finger protein HypA/HybF involved in hydrogenase expression
MSSERTERNRQIVELRSNGRSFVSIGKMFDIDSTAARNIWERETEKRKASVALQMCERNCLRCQREIRVEKIFFLCEPCRKAA